MCSQQPGLEFRHALRRCLAQNPGWILEQPSRALFIREPVHEGAAVWRGPRLAEGQDLPEVGGASDPSAQVIPIELSAPMRITARVRTRLEFGPAKALQDRLRDGGVVKQRVADRARLHPWRHYERWNPHSVACERCRVVIGRPLRRRDVVKEPPCSS